MLAIDSFKDLLSKNKVNDYFLQMSSGKIYWLDQDDKGVARARIKAVFSWAETNQSAMWASKIELLREAAVPFLQPEGNLKELMFQVKESDLLKITLDLAEKDGAFSVFPAFNGRNTMYLAVYDYQEENFDLSEEEIQKRWAAARSFILFNLSHWVEILQDKKRKKELLPAMSSFLEIMKSKYKTIFQSGADLEDYEKLLKSVHSWQDLFTEKPQDLKAFIGLTLQKWSKK